MASRRQKTQRRRARRMRGGEDVPAESSDGAPTTTPVTPTPTEEPGFFSRLYNRLTGKTTGGRHRGRKHKKTLRRRA